MKSCCEIDETKLVESRISGTNHSGHSCCDVEVKVSTSVCKECGNKGIPVGEITLKSLVKEPVLETIESLAGFYFCETPSCKAVYFNNEQHVYLYKENVNVRVGIKETESPIPVCYCFGWMHERIFEQIKQLGYSTAVQEINAKVKAGECKCEIKNPSGRCCLGNVYKVVKRGMELYGIKGGKIMNERPLEKKKKPGLIDPCPCGSGKKYKDCCGKVSCC